MNELIFLLIIDWIVSTDSRYLRQQDIKRNPLLLVFHSNPEQKAVPDDWPFDEKILNYITVFQAVLVIL